MTSYITLVYHHMGKLIQDSNMNLVYEVGEEVSFDNVNIEKISLVQMEDLFKGLGYKEYNYVYWLDEDMGFGGGGLNTITGDLDVLTMCQWAVSHDNSVHVYIDHTVDKAVEFVNLEEEEEGDNDRTQPQSKDVIMEDTPKKKRVKIRRKKSPIPKKKAKNKKANEAPRSSEDLLKKFSQLEYYSQPFSHVTSHTGTQPQEPEQANTATEEVYIPQSQQP